MSVLTEGMTWNRTLTIFLLTIYQIHLSAQENSVAQRYAASISVDDLRSRLEIIASDSLEGRETGERGQKKAAAYLSGQLQEFGVQKLPAIGEYQQPYGIHVIYPDTVKLSLGSEQLRFLKDFYAFNLADMVLEASEVVYMGYGIHSEKYSDYEGQDVRGKVVLISAGEPQWKGRSLVDPTQRSTEWSSDWRMKIKEANQRGARALLVIDPKISTSMLQLARYLRAPSMSVGSAPELSTFPVLFIPSEQANRLLSATGQAKGHQKLERQMSKGGRTVTAPVRMPLKLTVNRRKEVMGSENVVGYVEGSDRKDEVVVISCHYDHLGIKDGQIYNGADDDGSGTTALLELAQTFAQARKDGHGPRRSLLFVAFSGEEKGLLGSEFFTSEPVVPLKNVYVNLNIDMIGRVDKQHEPDSNYVYLIGADKISRDLHDLSERANATYTGLKLDYTYNDERDPNRFYYRSDHYNFARNGIPVIFYFTGVHKDYHKPSDTVEKIMFPKMQRIVQLIFHTAWELANREGELRK